MGDVAEPIRLLASSCVYALAYAVGIALFAWMARRCGVATDGIRRVVVAAIVGGLLGATLLQLAIGGEPGRTLLGGIVGGYVAVVFAKRRLGIVRPLGDLFAVALAGGEAVGRWGCFLAGCCYGRTAHLPWAVYDHGAWRHPTQIYASLAALATLVVLIALERRAVLPDRALFAIGGALLLTSRFCIEFVREPGPSGGPLTVAQWTCLGGLVFLFLTMRPSFARRPRTRTWSPA